MIKCPYCGSGRLETKGGDYGNPFDRRKEKTVCLDCGRTVGTTPNLLDLVNVVVCVEMTACGGGVAQNARAEFPYEDGTYPLDKLDYPLCRFRRLIIRGDTVDLDGEISKLTDQPLMTTKHFTAYAPDQHPEAETIAIKIYTDIKSW